MYANLSVGPDPLGELTALHRPFRCFGGRVWGLETPEKGKMNGMGNTRGEGGEEKEVKARRKKEKGR